MTLRDLTGCVVCFRSESMSSIPGHAGATRSVSEGERYRTSSWPRSSPHLLGHPNDLNIQSIRNIPISLTGFLCLTDQDVKDIQAGNLFRNIPKDHGHPNVLMDASHPTKDGYS